VGFDTDFDTLRYSILLNHRRRTLAPNASAVSKPTSDKNTFVSEIFLLTGGFDTSREKHAGLLNHRILLNKNGREIKSVFIFNFMTFVTTIKNHFGRKIDSSLETEWRYRGIRQARYPKFDATSN
jgi:hypothetical protein